MREWDEGKKVCFNTIWEMNAAVFRVYLSQKNRLICNEWRLKMKQLTKSMSKLFFNSWVVCLVHNILRSAKFNGNELPDHLHIVHSTKVRMKNMEQNLHTEKPNNKCIYAPNRRNLIVIHLSSKSAPTDTCSFNTYFWFVCRIIWFRITPIRYTCTYSSAAP